MPKPTPFKIISDIVSKTTHPWEYEPDLYEWTYRGIECIARRNMQTGSWCGYVDVPYSTLVDEFIDQTLKVHGGVSYNEYILDKDAQRIGFDCTQVGDKMPKLNHLANADSGDTYRDLAYVIAECESMVDQILEVTGGDVGDKP